MKLISCYIENFGTLHQYSLEFDSGVTVLREPNGFGKTTLAEFLRAMFYGFPRQSKTLEKNKRQKYLPWNGGNFGGNLVFEHEGVRYRMERSFGAAPKGDTFKLIDLSTNRLSSRFSMEIGKELFQMDADSFERSTYLPQNSDVLSLNTNNIQAKLSNLVQDTMDVGNLNKALQLLRNRRTDYVPMRGSGGSVGQADAQVTRLQFELDQTETKKAELTRCAAETEETEAQLKLSERQVELLRVRLTAASEAAARNEKRSRHQEMTARHHELTEKLENLRRTYPHGIPTPEETDEAFGLADRLAVLKAREVTTEADREAAAFLEANRCFEDHLPSEQELEEIREKCEEFSALNTQLESAALPEREGRRHEELRRRFPAGVPGEEKLDMLAQQSRQLQSDRAALENSRPEQSEYDRLENLGDMFAAGVPTDDELDGRKRELDRIEELQQEKIRLAEELASAAVPERKQKPASLPLALGAAALVLGLVLIVLKLYLPGGILMAAGALLAVLSVLKKKPSAESPETTGIWDKMAENDAERTRLQENLRQFVHRYIRTDSFGEGLNRIYHSREEYLALRQKIRLMEEKCEALEASLRQTEQALRRELGPVTDFDKAVSDLRVARQQYLDLDAKKQAADEKRTQLLTRIHTLEEMLRGCFVRYYPNTLSAQYATLLSRLQRDAEHYTRARAQYDRWQMRQKEHRQELEETTCRLKEFFARWALEYTDARQKLQRLREDEKALGETIAAEAETRQQLERYRAENAEILAAPEEDADAEALKRQLGEQEARSSELSRKLLQLQQRGRTLQEQTDRLPQLRDDLEFWQEKRREDQKKADLLDDTIAYLKQASDSLSTSYLGPIRQRFGAYLNRFMGEGNILITPDLQVQLERLGQARELGYFSAGQTDTVLLCMRFALVEALFGDEKPFVILDDPFVNLDDDHTAQALELLKELGKQWQIIYLCCNSSRSL